MNPFLLLLFRYLKDEKVEISLSELTLDAPICRIVFPDLSVSLLDILNSESYIMLRGIRSILDDDIERLSPAAKLSAIEALFESPEADL